MWRDLIHTLRLEEVDFVRNVPFLSSRAKAEAQELTQTAMGLQQLSRVRRKTLVNTHSGTASNPFVAVHH